MGSDVPAAIRKNADFLAEVLAGYGRPHRSDRVLLEVRIIKGSLELGSAVLMSTSSEAWQIQIVGIAHMSRTVPDGRDGYVKVIEVEGIAPNDVAAGQCVLQGMPVELPEI